MSVVLGVNAVFHDPAAALVVDGRIVAACEEERISRRKHGKSAVPFSTWELPAASMRWCLEHAGVDEREIDAVAYSYDPALAAPSDDVVVDAWEGLRTLYVTRAPHFVSTVLPGIREGTFRYVSHHLAHAASAALAGPLDDPAVLVLDGRGECHSHLAGRSRDGIIDPYVAQELPHSLGLMYEDLTEHLGFHRSSDEYKVMALASYADAEFIDDFRRLVTTTEDGGFRVAPIDWTSFVAPAGRGGTLTDAHAALAASVQQRLEEVVLELARWLRQRSGATSIALAGGVALNCVANGRLAAEGPFEQVWVQPAAGDAGTALGAAVHVARSLGDRITPMSSAAIGRGWSDAEIEQVLTTAAIPFERPADIAAAAAAVLAADGVIGWFQGRSEYGPRALGHRSLLATPARRDMLRRLNDVKGREQFRPVAPIINLERAGEVFDGVLPSPYMLFVHRVRDGWRDRIPAVVHVDGTARVQTVDRREEPTVAALLDRFEQLTGLPALVNTSFNTAGRPMVDDPRDALEVFGASPIDALVLGPFLVRRTALAGAAAG
jgi:carbamoyltransferase